MSLWEYKVITSGKGGFATPALLEKFLNDLGRAEWEIVDFQAQPDNFLAFTGLARRPTQRDWTLEDAAAAAAKAEAEKLRAEFEAKFKAATAPAPAEERASDFLHEAVAPDDGFRKPVDTSHDADPDAPEDEEKDEWEQLSAVEDEDLPTFFDAIKPHMRRNQRGPGMSVGVDYLAKKWDQSEEDLKGALVECGFVVPEDEDAKTEYLEYDGDLYWLNVNRRGELWINTKEKPRPVFRPVKAQKANIEEEQKPEPRRREERGQKLESGERRSEDAASKPDGEDKPQSGERPPEATEAAAEPAGTPPPEAASGELPGGPALLKKIRPHMRRNRRGPGGSGSTSFLARALRWNEADLKAALAGLGLKIPSSPSEKPVHVELGNEVWWLNADSRGGLWINGREKRPGETLGGGSTSEADAEAAAPAEESAGVETSIAAPDTPAEETRTGEPEANPALAANPESAGTPEQQPLRATEPPAENDAAAPVAPVLTNGAPQQVRDRSEAVTPLPVPANDVLAAVRPLLKQSKTGTAAAKLERIAEELAKSPDEMLAALTSAGLKVPEKPREKPFSVEQAGERLWLNKNAKGELWLNAKPSALAPDEQDEEEVSAGEAAGVPTESGEPSEADAEKKGKRPRSRKKAETEGT